MNWRTLQPGQRHLASVFTGIEDGAVAGIGYAYHRGSVLLTTEWSLPAGHAVTDDFKGTVGAIVHWHQRGAFGISSEVRGILRRYESPYVRLWNAGADISGTAGFYGHRWFVAGQVGFDKAIMTHIANRDLLRASYPAVHDGWYRATGGNFWIALQGGRAINNVDVHLDLGRIIEEDFQTSPTVPFHVRLGVTVRAGRPGGG